MGGAFFYIAPVLVFVVTPIFDFLGGKTTHMPLLHQANKTVAQTTFYKAVLWCHVILQPLIMLLGAYTAQFATPVGWAWPGFLISMALSTGGLGISVAHELIHQPRRMKRYGGLLLLLNVNYMHFFVSHLRVHHPHVGTPKDPTTALQNESFYRFCLKSIVSNFKLAWQSEQQRLLRRQRRFWHNQMLLFSVLPLAVVVLLWVQWGWKASLFYLLQSALGVILLEGVNYIEHYGLQREQHNGRYERVQIHHSWNANFALSNAALFMLQRHSDHHTYPARPYFKLRSHSHAPELPVGYAGLLPLILLPGLWFRLMNPRLKHLKKPV